ncbi:MAG: response regulator transcription factor [Verrucomicrobia bacterium]|nr:response regulator transcription factor [Verrucomicrobiota bacterium]
MIKILLAEDHRMVREGLRALLHHEPDFRVVGESGDGLDTLRLAEELLPDVVVTDLIMPGLTGLQVARRLRQRLPKTKVVLLSIHNKEAYVVEALRHGVAAYVLKDASGADLVRAVREALAGRRFLSPPLSRTVQVFLEQVKATGNADPYERLSSREREVLQLAAEGNTNATIASRLYISQRTVETHRANVMRKLKLQSQSDLICFAIRRGLLHVEPDEGRAVSR